MLRPQSVRALPRTLRRLPQTPSPSSLCSSRHLATVVQAEEKDPVELDQITALPNGIRVATEALPGHFSGIGVYVDAGSRYENDYLRDQMFESLETLGGNIQCASSRESLMYQSATFNSAVPTAVAMLAETIRDPLITEEEVQQQLETADYEIGEIWSKPELILPELVHLAAYKDNTLGNPLLCPKERLGEIDRTVVQAYRDAFYKPERMVVAFAGVEHEIAVKLTEQYFGSMQKNLGPSLTSIGDETILSQPASSSISPLPSTTAQPPYSTASTPSQEPSRLLSKIPFFKNLSTSASQNASINTPASHTPDFPPPSYDTPSHYTGGLLTLPPPPAPLNPAIPRLTHIHLAFEALPITHPDIYALATLQTLLGGGGSFSAGGPERASASCMPGQVGQMLDVMCRELSNLGQETGFSRLKDGEVQRAKNQLRSSLLMNLESRMVELEDLGRQVQVHGRKVGVKEMCQKIQDVTVQDLRRVAREVFGGLVKNRGHGSGAPTVVLQEGEERGNRALGWPEIQERIARWKLGRR
ncbi:Mitochondrial-processing peptidase subunit alpha [Coniosporium tulheliwenetii]|uniref:Mitochondrial-processing peptidase subunit alpha n=1 Tax=Coniosporium tulheliwenetii TaxID=3383036 RepID=A0ACC2YRW7_9PEZI|nr:Mitochondrial-processing peptidase subunit alpha [Cladosporium sp. JES 115]